MNFSLEKSINREFKRSAYRLLEPTIESIFLSARKSNSNHLELKKELAENISLYGGLFLYLRNTLPEFDKSTCAKISSSFLSEEIKKEKILELNESSDSEFLVSSIHPLNKGNWAKPKERLKEYFGVLNYNLSINKEEKIITPKSIQKNNKIKNIEEYEFNSIDRSQVIGNNELITHIENSISSLLHYNCEFKKNLFNFNQYILLSGQPGTGKTHLSKYFLSYAKKLSKENNLGLKIIQLDFEDRWQNGPLENIKYQLSEISKGERPYIIFLDELDLKFTNRNNSSGFSSEQVLGELLRFRGGVYPNYNNYLFLSTTNKPENIDYALRDVFQKYEIKPLTSIEDKIEILKLNLGSYSNKVNWEKLYPYLNKEITGRKIYQLSLESNNKLLFASKKIPFSKSMNSKKKLLEEYVQKNNFDENQIIKILNEES